MEGKIAVNVLPKSDYLTIHGLCAPFDRHLAVAAILAGETPAQIYVDNLHTPTVALLLPWDGHRVFLAGSTTDEAVLENIKNKLLELCVSPKQAAHASWVIIYYTSHVWEPYFQLLCQGMEIRQAMRQYYTLWQAPPDWQDLLPTTWRVRQIDATLLAEQHLQYLPELIEEMHSESPSREDFLTRKFGYCLQEDNTLIGWCLSEYNHGDRCEVGIATISAYRRRGVAYILASTLIEHALAHGFMSIGWHCWSSNIASGSLARKLGGTLIAEYPVQMCRLPQ